MPSEPPLSSPRELLLLSHSVISTIIRTHGLSEIIRELVERLEAEFARAAKPGVYTIPARAGVSGIRHAHPSLVEWMPSGRNDGDTALKIVGYHPANPAQFGLPTILATVSLIAGDTGAVKAILDGTTLTALRTAAASVTASRILAHPRSEVLGVVGCGAQAVAHIHALAQFFPIKRVLYFDTCPRAAASLAKRTQHLTPHVEFEAANPGGIRSQSDILCTATTTMPGGAPLFDDGACQPHLHINAVGSDFPGKKELPQDLLKRALVVPDFATQASAEGECQQLEQDEIGPELALVSANRDSWLQHRDSLTVFDSTGWALEDQIAAELFYEHAMQLQLGEWTRLDGSGADPLDPYEDLGWEASSTTPHRRNSHAQTAPAGP